MNEEEIIKIILDEAFYIHKTIGPGMLESVYQTCLAHRLRQRGLNVETEKPFPVIFEEIRMECGYKVDILVEKKVIVETKNIEAIADIHIAQILTYLRFLNLRHGLILNFKTVLLKNGIKIVLNGFDSKINQSTS
ncbi:MAG: GxxExxY protein [Chitinophagaceae bacterium]|nr:GxxExxY protein [Chitinophagaceae bacterium]